MWDELIDLLHTISVQYKHINHWIKCLKVRCSHLRTRSTSGWVLSCFFLSSAGLLATSSSLEKALKEGGGGVIINALTHVCCICFSCVSVTILQMHEEKLQGDKHSTFEVEPFELVDVVKWFLCFTISPQLNFLYLLDFRVQYWGPDVKQLHCIVCSMCRRLHSTYPSGEAEVSGHGPHQHHLQDDNSSVSAECLEHLVFHQAGHVCRFTAEGQTHTRELFLSHMS